MSEVVSSVSAEVVDGHWVVKVNGEQVGGRVDVERTVVAHPTVNAPDSARTTERRLIVRWES